MPNCGIRSSKSILDRTGILSPLQPCGLCTLLPILFLALIYILVALFAVSLFLLSPYLRIMQHILSRLFEPLWHVTFLIVAIRVRKFNI